jgi:hypothetical protein
LATPYHSSNSAIEETATGSPPVSVARNRRRTPGGRPLMIAMQALVSSR